MSSENKKKRMMKIVATTSLPAVERQPLERSTLVPKVYEKHKMTEKILNLEIMKSKKIITEILANNIGASRLKERWMLVPISKAPQHDRY